MQKRNTDFFGHITTMPATGHFVWCNPRFRMIRFMPNHGPGCRPCLSGMKRNPFQTSVQPADGSQPDRKEALRAAVRKYGSFVLDYLHSLVRDDHTVRDLAQDLWVHVWLHFGIQDFENPRLLRQKAYQIFVSQARKNGTRAFVRFTNLVPDAADGHDFKQPETPEEEEKFASDFWALFPGIQLTDQQKKAFILKHRNGNTLEEIAAQMNVPVPTVAVWVKNVIAKCRRAYTKELS